MGDDRLYGYGKLQRLCIPRSKVVDHPGKQHVEQPMAHLRAPARSPRAGQAHLRNHLPAKRTLVQVCINALPAESTLALLHDLTSQSAHAHPQTFPILFKLNPGYLEGQGRGDEDGNSASKKVLNT